MWSCGGCKLSGWRCVVVLKYTVLNEGKRERERGKEVEEKGKLIKSILIHTITTI